jgi:hypothetical protein
MYFCKLCNCPVIDVISHPLVCNAKQNPQDNDTDDDEDGKYINYLCIVYS